MNPIAEKYRLVWRSLSTTFAFATPAGSGALRSEPSSGVRSLSLIAGDNCADPKI
jgi:hypothetical protein